MPREDTQFKKGNPGGPGRTPGSRTAETLFRDAIKKIAEDQKVEDVERELVITLLDKAKKGDTKALEMYLDRMYGKPKQTIDNNVTGSLSIGDILKDIQSEEGQK